MFLPWRSAVGRAGGVEGCVRGEVYQDLAGCVAGVAGDGVLQQVGQLIVIVTARGGVDTTITITSITVTTSAAIPIVAAAGQSFRAREIIIRGEYWG